MQPLFPIAAPGKTLPLYREEVWHPRRHPEDTRPVLDSTAQAVRQELYDSRPFGDASGKTFTEEGLSGRRTYMVGDTKLEFTNDRNKVVIQATADVLLRAIAEANR